MNSFKSLFTVLTVAALLGGCATTQGKHTNVDPDMAGQLQILQNEIQVKDQQIQDLQNQLDAVKQSPVGVAGSANFNSSGKSDAIRVRGVSAQDVQSALVRVGLDPGPVDGKIGKKTKEAIREFQRRNNLKADGVVGERTWSYLKS